MLRMLKYLVLYVIRDLKLLQSYYGESRIKSMFSICSSVFLGCSICANEFADVPPIYFKIDSSRDMCYSF